MLTALLQAFREGRGKYPEHFFKRGKDQEIIAPLALSPPLFSEVSKTSDDKLAGRINLALAKNPRRGQEKKSSVAR